MIPLKEIYSKGNCPVCGYEMFEREDIYPWGKDGDSQSDEICSCCGIQFGHEDLTLEWLWKGDDMRKRLEIYDKWRNNWIENGMKWWSTDEEFHLQPPNWNPIQQLKNIGIEINKDGKIKDN